MFDIFITYSLDHLGPEWKDCYLKFYPITVSELNKMSGLKDNDEAMKETLAILQGKFVEGKAISEGKVVEVTSETLFEFPVPVLTDVMAAMTQGLDKKKESPSETPSED